MRSYQKIKNEEYTIKCFNARETDENLLIKTK